MTYPIFPSLPGIAYPVKRTALAKSLRQQAISGRQTVQPLWPSPLYKYELSFSLLRQGEAWQEWQALEGFWNEAMFQAPNGIFQFTDPNDDCVSGQATGTGDGTTTTFQLVRALGGFAVPVLLPTPVATAPAATLDYGNCTTAPGADLDYGNCTTAPSADLDYGYCSTLQVLAAGLLAPWSFVGGSAAASGGQVVIAPAPAANVALTWSGTFNWLCQFDEDTAEFDNFMYLFWELKKCAFTTIRL